MRAVQAAAALDALEPAFEEEREAERAEAIGGTLGAPGHPPPAEVVRLAELLREFEADCTRWDNLIAIGDVYRKGSFPRFRPNESLGIECFKYAAMCPVGLAAGTGQAKYIEARNDPIDDRDKAGDELPEEFGRRACDVARRYIELTPAGAFEKPVNRMPVVADRACARAHHGLGQPVPGRAGAVAVAVAVAAAPREPAAHMRDAQNVHDHSVTAITRRNIEALREGSAQGGQALDGKGDRDLVEEVRNAILVQDELGAREKSDAMRTLEDLRGGGPHSTLGATELDVLRLAWDRISAVADEATRANLTETLAKQLASGVERGSVVCSTGKITRIMGTFDGVDLPGPGGGPSPGAAMETARPMWAVREELAGLANKTREDELARLADAERRDYERGLRPDVERRMREEFERRASVEYCETLGMSRTIIEPLVATYAEGF